MKIRLFLINLGGVTMTIQGFDKDYYLGVKLTALQADPVTSDSWNGRDTAFLEKILVSFGFSAESHYQLYGWQEGFAPNPYFNAAEYKLSKATAMFDGGGYWSVANALSAFEAAWTLDPYQHYLAYGAAEGINPSSSFDQNAYFADKLAELQAAGSDWDGKTPDDLCHFFSTCGLSALSHYMLYGKNEGMVVKPVGGSSDDVNKIEGTQNADRLTGGSGIDVINGGMGDDIIRGGAGVDKIDAGPGDDKIVIVGDLSGGGKKDTDEDSAILGFPLTDLNFKDLNEDEDGAAEIIIGGDGNDTLYVYGTADLSNYTITGIEHIIIRSDVIFSNEVLQAVSDINGDGSSTIRIIGKTPGLPITLDLSQLKLTNIGHIELGKDVTLKIDSLDQLGGARILTGEGTIMGKQGGTLALPDTYTIETKLKIKNDDGNGGITDAVINAQILDKVINGQAGKIITGTAGNDYLIGTDTADIFDGGAGNDVMTGKGGDDIFKVTASGEKIIIDNDTRNNNDVLDLSGLNNGYGAIIDMTTGGSIGSTSTIQIGASKAGGASGQIGFQSNVMLIMDVSGSMGGTRIVQIKKAANQLLDAYDTQGDLSVRIVEFESSANSTYYGADVWVDIATAKNIINGLSAGGGTDYSRAMSKAKQAFVTGQSSAYLAGGSNVSYFLSDGQPNSSIASQENSWENFLIDNGITSHAIGFGGLSNTSHLEPLAFDGTKVASSTDDHTPGEIPATIEVDTTNLGNTLVDTAKLDFLENIIGTDFNDTITGNSLNNQIDGGTGEDITVFSGNFEEYTISIAASKFVVTDNKTGRAGGSDGTDTLSNIEILRFADGDKKNYELLEKAVAIFSEEAVGGDPNEAEVAGRIRVMADFAKAAYSLKDFEKDTSSAIFNDKSDGADDALSALYQQGWVPLNLNVPIADSTLNIPTGNNGDIIINVPTRNGIRPYESIFTNENAAALVLRSKDSVVISFRGTNDNREEDADSGEINKLDPHNTIHPDVLQWGGEEKEDSAESMADHYALYNGLITALKAYINNADNTIDKVFVTGHSMGGAMAIEFMSNHTDAMYEAITFAAPAFTGSNMNRQEYDPDDRILQIEILNDPVPITWDTAEIGDNRRPGNVLQFAGDLTMDAPDHYGTWPVSFYANDTNHSMDYYREITDAIDPTGWKIFLDENKTGVQKIFIGGERDKPVVDRLEKFYVDTGVNVLSDPSDNNYNIYYGGKGDDILTGGPQPELFLGGRDNDILNGGIGNDILTGGPGADRFIFNAPSEGLDTITDFESGLDKLVFAKEAFTGFDSVGALPSDRLIVGKTPAAKVKGQSVFLFNTDTSTLSFDIDGADEGIFNWDKAPQDFVILAGVNNLVYSDFLLA